MTVPLLHAVACQGGKPAPLEIGTAAAERTERVHRYERTFTLPTTVDASAIKATYEHRVLTVTLPKVEKTKPRECGAAGPRARWGRCRFLGAQRSRSPSAAATSEFGTALAPASRAARSTSGRTCDP